MTTDANDVNQLKPRIEQCEDLHGERPENVLADAGYWQEVVTDLQDEETELYIATRKYWKRRKELAEEGPPRGRIPKDHGSKELMEWKLWTKPGRKIYHKRARTVEPVFGQRVNRGCDRSCYGESEELKRSGRCFPRRISCWSSGGRAGNRSEDRRFFVVKAWGSSRYREQNSPGLLRRTINYRTGSKKRL